MGKANRWMLEQDPGDGAQSLCWWMFSRSSEAGWHPSSHHHRLPSDIAGVFGAKERYDARTVLWLAYPGEEGKKGRE